MSDISNDFIKRIDNTRPVFFHWLDGFIKEDIGNRTDKTFQFISEKIGPLCTDKDIIIACPFSADIKSDSNPEFYLINYDWFKFQNLKTNEQTFISLDQKTQKIIISTDFKEDKFNPVVTVSDSSYYDFSDATIKLSDLFKYCIFQCNDELHGISLLTFIKQNQMFLSVVNSGEGINKIFDPIEINQISCCSPHFSYLICDDMSNPTKLESALKSIMAALEFNSLYDELQHIQKDQIIDDEDKYVIEYKTNQLTVLKRLEFVLANATGASNINFGSGTLFDFAQITPKSFFYKDKNLDEFVTNPDSIKLTEPNLTPTATLEYLVLDHKYEFATTLYIMYCKFFKDISTKLTIPREIVPEISFNVDEIREPNTLSKLVLEKMVFQIFGLELYIIPQQSGSCSWYSMYWPLLMYNIYYEPNITKYKNFVKDINSTFKRIIEDLFSVETFDSLFSKTESNLWQMYYNGFCNIGLLKRENLEQYSDFLFNGKFKISLENLSPDNSSSENKNISNLSVRLYSSQLVNINKNFIGELKKIELDNLSNFGKVFIELTYKLAQDLNVTESSQSNTIVIFYNFLFNELEANGIQTDSCFNSDFINGKISKNIFKKIRSHLSSLETRGHKNDASNKIVPEYEKKLSNWFNYLKQTVNPDSIQIYNFYHWATFFSQDNTDPIQIKSRAQFMCRAFIISNIFVEIFNLFYKLKLNNVLFHTDTELATKINEYLQTIFVSQYTEKPHKFFPENFRKLEDYLDSYKIVNLNLKSNYLTVYNSYNFNPSSDPDLKTLIKNKTYKEFLEEREFFYTNPEFIYSKFSNDNPEEINFDTFVKINIFDILNPSNLSHRKTLLKFYGKKFAYFHSNKSKRQELFYTLENLHLLIFGTELKQEPVNKYNFDYTELKYFLSNTDSLAFETKLSQQLKDYGTINFPQHLSDNFREISETFIDKLVKQLKQTYPNTRNISNKIYIGEPYELLDFKNTNNTNSNPVPNSFFKFFSSSDNYPNVLVNSEAVHGKTSQIKFIVIEGNYVFDIVGTNIGNELSISNIFVNNNPVIKLSELNFPFKYSMPLTCSHLFFKTSSTINVIYFVKQFNSNNKKSSFLNEIEMDNQICEFSINENTMLYPKITDDNTLITFGNLCKNYHIRPLNIFYTKPSYSKSSDSEPSDWKLRQLFEWTDENFLKQPFNPVKTNQVVLMNKISDIDNLMVTTSKIISQTTDQPNSKLAKLVDLSETNIAISYEKLLDKIESCRIIDSNKEKTIGYLESLLKQIEAKQVELVGFYASAKFRDLFDLPNINYMGLIKISNTIKQLLRLINNQDLFCSQLKILRELFNSRKYNCKYNFEFLFEIISGYELLEEQQSRYFQIINNYDKKETKPTKKEFTDQTTNIINYQQTGGRIYPLHHFMMGKGKSSVMTPLLTLYFSLIHNLNPIIIVPEHLVTDTKSVVSQYAEVFSRGKACKVLSDTEVKNNFLNGDFLDETTNTKTVFIIDEFDSLIDPTKSNFNVVKEKTVSTFTLFKFINQVVNFLKTNNIDYVPIKQVTLFNTYDYSDQVICYIIDEINQTFQNIKSGIFIENIHWGIDKNKYYAVPYANKDKPIANSSFSSSVLTIFLTLYYYVILRNYEISDLVVNFVVTNNLYTELFETKEPDENISFYIKKLCENPQTKSKLFTRFFDEIFGNFKLPESQLNTSFVDIVNINGIYKVGYSGTVNIDFPEFIRSDELFNLSGVVPDTDEIINVTHALIEANTIVINKINEFEQDIVRMYIDKTNGKSNFNQYGAFIDQVGVFKNIPNIQVAQIFFEYFNKIRNVIFMSETDVKFVITDTGLENYSSSKKYSNPFIYYSQGHVVGVDIRQDYLPELKGLVTINSKSTYTNVAQSIFRLRKINLGHTIDILFISNPDETDEITINNSIDIYNLIKSNDEKSKANKHDLLIYQTLKSEVRKNNLIIPLKIYNKNKDADPINSKQFITIKFNQIYTEKIKYYYIDVIPTNYLGKIEEYLSGIIEIPSNRKNLIGLVSQINQTEKLNKLIFNIGSGYQEISRATETEKVKVKVSIKNKSIETTYYAPDNLAGIQTNFDYWQYLFSEISNPDIFYRITIKINDFIYCVPNISSQFNGNAFVPNKSGLIFVLIWKINKLLLVPGYMAYLFYQSHLLLRIDNLRLINLNQIDQFKQNAEIIRCLRESPMIKFIRTGLRDNFPIDNLTLEELFVLKVIIVNLINKHNNHQIIIDKVNKQKIDEYNGKLLTWSQFKHINQIIIPNDEQNPSEEPFIISNAEYRCDKNKRIYWIEYKKDKESNENDCEENKSIFFRQIQSKKDKEKQLIINEQKKLIKQEEEICEANKQEYKENVECETNKDNFANIPNVDLCSRYKVEYLNEFYELNGKKILKLTDRINKYNKKIQSYNEEIKAKDEEITAFNKQKTSIKIKEEKKNIDRKITEIGKEKEEIQKLINDTNAKLNKYKKELKEIEDVISNISN